ncbi:MAG: glycosyltransferase family 4 protein [Verrucomicrobiales bacterium]|nr:glycosyltransferase family 4 protein [Verrucomicrobiales bacterium]
MKENPRIVYITAGAGGMYCGSCIRDNALVTALEELGWDVLLLPLYTPIRVDEEDHSMDQVFFGGINVYLQQKIPLFRHIPAFLDRWLDNPKLIRRVSSRAMSVSAADLGEMTLSMVKGEHGYQRKEVARLVHWLKEVVKPDLICLTNLLVGGSIPALKRELDVPVLVTIQGDDVFLDELQPPWHDKVLAEMKKLAAEADGFLTFSAFYRDLMAGILEVDPGKFHLTPLGVHVEEFDPVWKVNQQKTAGSTIGYFARLSPEKGFDLIIDAFIELARGLPGVTLKVAGWLSEKDREFYAEQIQKIGEAGLENRFEHVEAPDAEAKLKFFSEVDLFCVPTRFEEPKGLYVLEAMACGLPVVAPSHGPFPELITESCGGSLFEAKSVQSLQGALVKMLSEPLVMSQAGESGRKWVETSGSRETMAKATAEVFRDALAGKGRQG